MKALAADDHNAARYLNFKIAEYAKAVMTVYRELLDGKRDLDNARLQLLSAKQEIEDNQKRISDGLSQLDKAQAQIDQGRMTLAEQKNRSL